MTLCGPRELLSKDSRSPEYVSYSLLPSDVDGLGQVGFFRTSFRLNLPKGYDIPLAFVFDSQRGHYRGTSAVSVTITPVDPRPAQLYVNGWQMGKRVANIGPQTTFVVHEGILNYQGHNVVGVSLWALGATEQDRKIPSIKLVAKGMYKGGIGKINVDNPGWDELRKV